MNYTPSVHVKSAVRETEFKEKVVEIKRVSNTTKGGKQIAFSALVVSGDGKGKVGIGLGKAKSVADAIQKATSRARRAQKSIKLVSGTIPYILEEKYKAAKIILRPAKPGTGLIAGGAVRAVAEVAGIKDLVSKIRGSRNKSLNVWATVNALSKARV